MPRSRSRTPPLKRERRRSRSRERKHRKKRSRSPRSPPPRYRSPAPRQRSISPPSPPRRKSPSRKRSREREKEPSRVSKKVSGKDNVIDESRFEGLDEEQMEIMKKMGFATFDSTKGKKVDGNDMSAVNLQRKRRYRQYMNRRGGFNRPLDFVA
ncbi:hypothetical protein BsWGS_04219 [Bradybaena similaris]